MTFRECSDLYLEAVTDPAAPWKSLKGEVRDEKLRPLSCVPVLAFDNHGYSYPVFIDLDFSADPNNGRMILYLVGAPSGWRLSDLLNREGGFMSQIALDHGQGWYCTNFQAVLAELVAAGVK